jgi:ribosomal protein L29
LNSKHQELKEEFMRIRCNTVLSADSDVHQMRKTRKDIARINTILNEKNRTTAAEK